MLVLLDLSSMGVSTPRGCQNKMLVRHAGVAACRTGVVSMGSIR